ncbi:MAG: chromosome segregation ATPase [Cyanobacteria bacterium P01_D01_bin.105]
MASKHNADNSASPKRSSPAPTNFPYTQQGNGTSRKPVRSIRKSARSSQPPTTTANPNALPSKRPSPTASAQATSQMASAPTASASTHHEPSQNKVVNNKVITYLLGMRWLRSWPLFVIIIFGVVGTAGTTAVVSLFRIPSLPNCRAVFWPTASASLRLQCAETYAAQGDVQNLLAAIALVDKLPTDHPLRSDIIDDRIEDWANQVLDLAEKSFEAGDLELAIASARKVPARTAAAAVVEERIERWQKIWKEGSDAFNAAMTKLKEKNFQSAFSLSVKLLDVPNEFWATVKYNELTQMIGIARDDSRKMSEALGLAKAGTVKGFTEALKRLDDIDEESVFYAEAQGQRKDVATKMLVLGEKLLASQKILDARTVLAAIPRDLGFEREIEDFQIFVTAYQQAWTGTVGGLQNAIRQMKALDSNRPRYGKGQQLIAQWNREIQNLALLTQAKERAVRGSTADLAAAINVAQRVPRNSPQWSDASDQIDQWRTRVETVQDRPILERADQLAASGSTDGLRAAIQEARKISAERTLGKEADQRIETWTGRIQRIEDQPVITQARQRAQAGDLAGAIAIARQIGEGRALYDDAQSDIAGWQAQEDGRLRLDEAVKAAAQGDADSLANAIEIAQRVPTQSSSRRQANDQINRWSWDLLRQAESTAGRNVESAIALASRIPAQTEAYEAAQVRISNWQETLRLIEETRRPAPRIPASSVDGNGFPTNLELNSPGE